MSFKKTLLNIERFILYINVVFALFLLLSYLSAVINPQTFWPVAFFGLAYPVFLFINLLFCIYWVIRLKKYFFISAISILLGLNILLNSIGLNYFSKRTPSLLKGHLKLMTYNVHNFQNLDLPRNLPAYKPILKLINLNQPDVVGFEEYSSVYSRFKICDSLKKTLHTNQFYFEPFIKTKWDSTGLALYSKYPIINKGMIRLSNERRENQVIYIDIKSNSRVVRIYAFHLQSIELDDEDNFVLKNFFHRSVLSPYRLNKIFDKLKQGFVIRGQQVDIIRKHAAKCPYPYVFMGDFNDTPSSYAFNQMAIGMKDAFREKGTGIGRTFKGGFASFQIDYILVSKQFDVFNYQIIHEEISDHFPICGEVALN